MTNRSQPPGESTSNVEVTRVAAHGFWLALDAEELFVSYADFPWFREAALEKLTHVERPHSGHLYWPELDIDLAVESIRDPGAFPLVARR